jgi:hypothetical protein
MGYDLEGEHSTKGTYFMKMEGTFFFLNESLVQGTLSHFDIFLE